MTPRARAPSRLSQAAIWLGGALLALAALFAALTVQREEALGREISRFYDARQALLEVLDHLQDAENGQRSYILTHDRDFLVPYYAARGIIGGRQQIAAAYFSGDAAQSQRMEELKRLTAAKEAELDRTVQLSEAGRPEGAADLVASGKGRRLMTEIRSLVTELSAKGSDKLEAWRTARLRLHGAIMVVGAALILLLLAFVLLGLMRELRGRRERDQLQDSLTDSGALMKAIFESASDGIVTIDPRGGIETINAAGAGMFGYTPEELLHQDVSLLADVAERYFERFQVRLAAGDAALAHGIVQELTARRKDGSTFIADVALRGMPLPDGVHVVAVVRDISERRRAEEMKEAFVSNVSHELRTPLTSIAGALGLLRSGAAGILPDPAARLVHIAEANSARLVRLINDILDIEKIEAGEVRLELQPHFLNELAKRAADAMSGLAEQKDVRLKIECSGGEPTISGDADRLMQVLTNLLSNAIKVSAPGATILLKCSAEDGTAALSVVDRGPGVPESFRPRLFQKFAQADTSDAKAHGGSGLGLAISREIAERHAGRLTYAPTPGGGATFTLELPRSPLPDAERPSGAASRRLLVCEDDPVTADFLRYELAAQGYEVTVAGGANEARLALHSESYAALLLDLGLPDIDGLTLVRTLRAAPGTRSLPIIIISGSVDDQDDGRLLDVVDWIGKPIELRRLREAVTTALSHEGRRRRPLILHIDADRDLVEVTRAVLGGAGEVVGAGSLKHARTLLASRRPDVVILDLGLPDGSGADLMAEVAEFDGPAVPVIIYTAQEPGPHVGSRATAVFTKSRVGVERLADAVSRITHPESEEVR